MAASHGWPDAGLVRDGLQLLDDLSRPSVDDVLLATDLHAGNVLRAQREPWLVIDPKPFVGDRAYDATQHLMNCKGRMLHCPDIDDTSLCRPPRGRRRTDAAVDVRARGNRARRQVA